MWNVVEQIRSRGLTAQSQQRAIRLVTTHACQWRCAFCHHEGTKTSADLRINSDLTDLLNALRDQIGYDEVHLTGGEPTCYPDLFPLIQMCSDQGFKVKITTNGQADQQTMRALINYGISGVNFSVHTLNPESLARFQHPAVSVEWATRQIANQEIAIDALLKSSSVGKLVKINTVVADRYRDALDVLDFCRARPDLQWRPMNELSTGQRAYSSLKSMVSAVCGRYTGYSVINGSSSCAVSVELPDGYQFRIKMIRPFHLASVCSGCSIYREGGCREGIYGIRVEQRKEGPVVRFCIHRNDRGVIMSPDEFMGSDACVELASKTKRGDTYDLA